MKSTESFELKNDKIVYILTLSLLLLYTVYGEETATCNTEAIFYYK